MQVYKCLSIQEFNVGKFNLVPIRMEDRFKIMKWRNEQIYHLRQQKRLTKEVQNQYFDKVVSKLFDLEYPDQILFSYLEGNKCLGYGGLVHINWIDKNAEISFIMDTDLENDYFEIHWKTFLQLIEKVAFEEIKLHKIYTYAFDLRPHLFVALEKNGYIKDAVLQQHCFCNKQFLNVVIHCKIRTAK